MKLLKNIILFFVRLIKFFLIVSTILLALVFGFYFLFLSESNIDLKNQPNIKDWIGKTFILNQGVFIYQFSDEKQNRYYLGSLPKDVIPPSTLEDFLENSEKWDYFNSSWRRPLMPGTEFKITRIYLNKAPLVGRFIIIEALLLNGDYKNQKVLADFLFKYKNEPYSITGFSDNIVAIE
jgi:hypothetical protein